MVAIAPARLDPPPAPEPAASRRLYRLVTPLSLALVSLPILARIVPAALSRPSASNFGDTASTEMAVQNALKLHQSLGPYDRFGWSHPGPMLFYLLAIPYRLMGQAALALNVGAGLINLGAVVGVVVIIRRRAGAGAAVAAAAIISAFLAADGLSEMSHAWSPVVIRWPALLFIVCCADWGAFGGWSLLWSALLGSFLVQTEVGLGPVVALALLLALTMRVRRRDPSPQRGLVAGVTAAATVLVWIPTFVQEWTGTPSNLSVVIRFFTSHHAAHRFAHTFAGVADGMLSGIGPGRLDNVVLPDGNYTTPLILVLVGGALIAGLCVWRRRPMGFALAAGAVVLAVAYALSLTRAVDRLGGYLAVWAQALTVAIAIAAAVLVGGRRLGAAALLALAGVAGYQTYAGAASPLEDSYATVTIAARATERWLAGSDRHLLVCTASVGTWPHAEGVLADLRRDGWDARVQHRWQFTDPELPAPSRQEHIALVVQLFERGIPMSRIAPTKPAAVIRGGGLRILVYRSPRPVTEALCPAVIDG